MSTVYIGLMPPPMRYPEKLLVRLAPGSRERIAALQEKGEQLADTQRRVVEAGIAVLEAEPRKAKERTR